MAFPGTVFFRKKSILGGLGDPRGDPKIAKNEQKDNCANHPKSLFFRRFPEALPSLIFSSPGGSPGGIWEPPRLDLSYFFDATWSVRKTNVLESPSVDFGWFFGIWYILYTMYNIIHAIYYQPHHLLHILDSFFTLCCILLTAVLAQVTRHCH